VRLRIDLAYHGGEFHGWAAQPGLRTVQGDLEAALCTVLRVGEAATVCAGRTDTGVHARGQVVHVDVADDALVAAAGRSEGDPADAVTRRLNGVLPADLRVRRVVAAPDGFDARFSPLWRRYAYRLCDGVPDPLTRGHVLAWPRALDLEAMNEASGHLLGLHDFAAFCKQREGATTVRTLLELAWLRDDDLIVGTVRADAFCHHMVRSLVGCLVAVGEGRRVVTWPAEVLAGAVRDPAVTVVPPHGLTLEEVGYPRDEELAARAGRARSRREAPQAP
jgi:tRNA pseudouridine38-40 synthase